MPQMRPTVYENKEKIFMKTYCSSLRAALVIV